MASLGIESLFTNIILKETVNNRACFEQGVPWLQANMECGFTLKCVRDLIITYRQINNCVNDLHNKNLHNGKSKKSDLFKLFEAATSESSFIFDSLHYRKIDGVAANSPLGPTLVNVFPYHYEKEFWTIVHVILNLLYTEGMLMKCLFFFHLENISSLL